MRKRVDGTVNIFKMCKKFYFEFKMKKNFSTLFPGK